HYSDQASAHTRFSWHRQLAVTDAPVGIDLPRHRDLEGREWHAWVPATPLHVNTGGFAGPVAQAVEHPLLEREDGDRSLSGPLCPRGRRIGRSAHLRAHLRAQRSLRGSARSSWLICGGHHSRVRRPDSACRRGVSTRNARRRHQLPELRRSRHRDVWRRRRQRRQAVQLQPVPAWRICAIRALLFVGPLSQHGIPPECAASRHRRGLAYAVGCSEAATSVRHLAQMGLSEPRVWWLDVEPSNVWSGNRALNTSVLRGMMDYLDRFTSAVVGFYSLSSWWNSITTRWKTTAPEWIPSRTRAVCPNHFSAGPVWLAQGGGARLDLDVAC